MDKQEHRSYLDRNEVLSLIDKFVGNDVSEEVHRMFIRDEATVSKLMFMLRDYHDRNVALTKKMHEAEKEYFDTLAPKVSSGCFTADAALNPAEMTKVYRMRWDPGAFYMTYVMADQLREDKNPIILEMIEQQFQRQLEAELIPQLRMAYRKMITASH